jgi:hypothetical protein
VFLALGGWGLRTHRAIWVVPLASLAGVLLLLALTALVPGTPGTCDT